METIIETIKSLDKETAKDLKLIAEQSFECVRKLEKTDEEKERLYNIIEMIIETTKERIIKISTKELETI